MKRLFKVLTTILFVILILQVGGLGQKQNPVQAQNDNWVYLGMVRTFDPVNQGDGIIVDPNNKNKLWVVNFWGIQKSEDRGKTWKPYYLYMGRLVELTEGIATLGINNLYHYGEYYYFNSVDCFYSQDEILKTKDWENFEVVYGPTRESIDCFWISPDEQTIYFGETSTPGNNFHKLWRSLDGGKTFKDLGNNILIAQTKYAVGVSDIFVDPQNNNTIIVKVNEDTLISYNQGESFERLTLPIKPIYADSADELRDYDIFELNGHLWSYGISLEDNQQVVYQLEQKEWVKKFVMPNDVEEWWWRAARFYQGYLFCIGWRNRIEIVFYSDDEGKTWHEFIEGIDLSKRDKGRAFSLQGDELYYIRYGYLYYRDLKTLYPTITSISQGNGSITPNGEIKIKRNSSLTFTITPNPGYYIKDVKVDGISVGPVTTYTFDNITSDHTIQAIFEINTYTIRTVFSSGGSITPQGNIQVKSGSSLTFIITPNPGYYIKDVLVDNQSVGPVTSYAFTNVTSDHTIQVIFEQQIKETILTLRINSPYLTVIQKLNGKITSQSLLVLDSAPIIKNNRTLVPIRAIIESLGGTIDWEAKERKVSIFMNYNIIELWIGESIAKVNGINTPIDPTNSKVVPEIINSRTMLPLRFIAENLGCDVQWDGTTKTITITYLNRGG